MKHFPSACQLPRCLHRQALVTACCTCVNSPRGESEWVILQGQSGQLVNAKKSRKVDICHLRVRIDQKKEVVIRIGCDWLEHNSQLLDFQKSVDSSQSNRLWYRDVFYVSDGIFATVFNSSKSCVFFSLILTLQFWIIFLLFALFLFLYDTILKNCTKKPFLRAIILKFMMHSNLSERV